jgi:hypothetical protein
VKIDCYTYLRALVVVLSLSAACHSADLSSPGAGSNTASSNTALSKTASASASFVAQWSGFKFTHPGILSSAADLAYLRTAIAAGIEPQAAQYGSLSTSPPASYTAHPVAHPCSGLSGASSATCNEQTWSNQLTDANTAYTYALIAALNGNLAYATAAENILDAWVTGGPPGQPNPANAYKGNVGLNWYLCTAWISYQWAEVAEILRTTDPSWAGAQPFGKMLNNYVLPVLHHRHAFGNRGWAVINGLMAIGVYNDDPAAFAEGVTDFNNLIQSYYFMAGDSANNQPLPMNYYLYWPTDVQLLAADQATAANHWQTANGWTSYVVLAKNVVNLGDDTGMLANGLADPASLWTISNPNCGLVNFVSGYTAETCRDLGHTQMAMSLTFNSAQIAWNQGVDLYSPNAQRLTVAMELVESWILGASPAPLTVTGNDAGSFEMAYNHFANIMGMQLPNSQELVALNRSAKRFGAVGYQNGINCDTLPSLTSGANELCNFQLSTTNSINLFSRDLAAQNSGYTGLWTVLMFGDLNKADSSYP